jgi:hypothetical protein
MAQARVWLRPRSARKTWGRGQNGSPPLSPSPLPSMSPSLLPDSIAIGLSGIEFGVNIYLGMSCDRMCLPKKLVLVIGGQEPHQRLDQLDVPPQWLKVVRPRARH